MDRCGGHVSQKAKRYRKPLIPVENTRRLVANLLDALDYRLMQFRKGTQFEKARMSDILTFVAISHGHDTISKIALLHKVSRQAVHLSTKRLRKMEVIEIQPLPGGKRDMQLVLSRTGQDALQLSAKRLKLLESEIESVVGKAGHEKLRKQIVRLTAHFSN